MVFILCLREKKLWYSSSLVLKTLMLGAFTTLEGRLFQGLITQFANHFCLTCELICILFSNFHLCIAVLSELTLVWWPCVAPSPIHLYPSVNRAPALHTIFQYWSDDCIIGWSELEFFSGFKWIVRKSCVYMRKKLCWNIFSLKWIFLPPQAM